MVIHIASNKASAYEVFRETIRSESRGPIASIILFAFASDIGVLEYEVCW